MPNNCGPSAAAPFHLDEHLGRLEHSLSLVGIDAGMSRQQLGEIARELTAHNHRLMAPGDDLGLSIFVTPGPYRTFAGTQPERPLVCMHTYPLPFRLWAGTYRVRPGPGDDRSAASPRRLLAHRAQVPQPHALLPGRPRGGVDRAGRAGLALDHEGFVTEASTANALAYRADEGLLAPPLEKVLRGISMGVVVELAQHLGIPFRHRELRPDDFATADEAMLTSTSVCLLPVTRFNGRPVGQGTPGPVFHRILDAWKDQVGFDFTEQARRFAGRV